MDLLNCVVDDTDVAVLFIFLFLPFFSWISVLQPEPAVRCHQITLDCYCNLV